MTNLPHDVEHLGIAPVEVDEPEPVKAEGADTEEGTPIAEDDPSNLTGPATITGAVPAGWKPYPNDYLLVTQGSDGDWYWARKAGNHETISHGEGYESRGSKTASLDTQAAGAVKGALRANPDLSESDVRIQDPEG